MDHPILFGSTFTVLCFVALAKWGTGYYAAQSSRFYSPRPLRFFALAYLILWPVTIVLGLIWVWAELT